MAGDFLDIARALEIARAQRVNRDPWISGANAFGGMQVNPNDTSGWGTAVAALSGLGRGIASGREQALQSDYDQQYLELAKALGAQDEAALQSNPLYSSIAPQIELQKAAQARQAEAEQAKIMQDFAMKKELERYKSGLESSQQASNANRQQLAELNKEFLKQQLQGDFDGNIEGFDVDPSGKIQIKRREVLPAEGLASPAAPNLANKDAVFKKEEPSLTERMDARAKELLRQGTATRGTVRSDVQKLFAGELQEQKEFQTKIEEEFNRAALLRQLAAEAKGAVEKAGTTGGGAISKGVRETVRSIGKNLGYAPAEESLQGQDEMNTLKQDTIRMNYIKGTGATSNMETEAMLKSGISPLNTKETNEKLIKKYMYTADVIENYAKAKKQYLKDKGTLNGFEEKWADFRNANPFIKVDENGEVQVKEKLPDWKKYFKEKEFIKPNIAERISQLRSGQ